MNIRKLALCLAGLLVFAASTFAEPAGIEFGAIDVAAGTFTLQFPAADKALELYYAEAWADDSPADYSQWRAPVFLRDIPAGMTEATVTVSEFQSGDTARFFLADPANATVTRPVSVIGGKNGSDFDSAFVTGLHPNYDWKYDLVFDVPEFGSNQAWLLCNRNNNYNQNSLLHFIVQNSSAKKLRFGHGTHNNIVSTSAISANVMYQAAINGRVCVVSNLTDNVLFYTFTANASTANYGEFSFWFGASSGSDGRIYNTNDKCSFARVYSFKAWDGTGALVGDFRPMVTNGVTGYFDLVTRAFFKSGDGVAANETHTFTPYVASSETQHVDSLVAHLGDLVAVSPVPKVGPVELVSESLGFAIGGSPAYGTKAVSIGGSVTLGVPADEFIWWDVTTKMSYRVRSAGLRIDAYDANSGAFIEGTPQKDLRNYTFTRHANSDGVRVVCLWDAEMLVDPLDGLRADCLRLVGVDTNANGKTEVGHGPFNTAVHPVPATTRVYFDVSIDDSNYSAQCSASPVNERRFFGVRDAVLAKPASYETVFQICRVRNGNAPYLRVDMCNAVDGASVSDFHVATPNSTFARFQFDVNPYFTRVANNTSGLSHLVELKDVEVERSSTALNGTLHIFGQQRLHDTTAPLCVDYNNTRYYSYTVWTDGINLSRDYVSCIDANRKPAFYDRVGGNYIYPIGDKAEFVAEFDSNVGTNSVYVTGENELGGPAAYLDPDGVVPGYYTIAPGASESFVATKRNVFGRRVVGYRVDTWDEAAGWQKGAVQSARSVTLNGEDTIRRLVWIWQDASDGLVIILR